jgi:hypothetical protein
LSLETAERACIDAIYRELGLWGLDAPEDIGAWTCRWKRWWARSIAMVGGAVTYEAALEDCRAEGWKLLGIEGGRFAPQRVIFGVPLFERQAYHVHLRWPLRDPQMVPRNLP